VDDQPLARRPATAGRAGTSRRWRGVDSRRLVVTGWYRFVRNPLYVAVVAMIVGQGLLFGNVTMLEYALAAWVIAYVWVLINEEPYLRRAFGSEYDAYCRAVHRWIPRVRPYTAAAGAPPRA
jgi:protein-S-isoprenylcysteine O-methyltransferase Ste14